MAAKKKKQPIELRAFIWSQTVLPKPPWKLWLITADYRPKNSVVKRPVYEVCSRSEYDARLWFKRTFSWLEIYSVEQAPPGYRPNIWLYRENQST